MSDLNMLPVPVVQMGLVEKLVEAEQNQPHVQQLVGQEIARQALKAEAERVPVVDSTEHGQKIRKREGRHERKGRQHASSRSSGGPGDPEEADGTAADEAASPTSNPWAGQIVNMKV